MDKLSLKLLKALAKGELSEDRVNKILRRQDVFQPDSRLSALWRDKFISSRIVEAIPDGSGGYVDGSVKRAYRITPAGLAYLQEHSEDRRHYRASLIISALTAIIALLALVAQVCPGLLAVS